MKAIAIDPVDMIVAGRRVQQVDGSRFGAATGHRNHSKIALGEPVGTEQNDMQIGASLKNAGETTMSASLAKAEPHGYEVGYDSFTINGKMLGHSEPFRVKQGERVPVHVLNGSIGEIRSLALPTDESLSYRGLDGAYIHNVINHANEYVKGHTHTTDMENFWSLSFGRLPK